MSSEAATEFRQRGEAAILARVETSSDDIVGIQAAAGVLTARGGMTSHAAVVARGMGRSAVVGASALQIDYVRQELRTREHVVRRGEIVTIDGNSGEVLLGAVPLRAAHLHHNPDYGQLMAWADQHASLQVLAEADTPAQAQLCRDLGLLGIGLSRSERLLCHPERAAVLREVCERPQSDTARERLAEALTASYRDLLATAPAGETMLRLLDPVAAGVLLAADDCELAARERALLTQVLAGYRRSPVEEAARQIPSARAGAEALHPALPSPTEVLRAIWHAQVQAIARAQQALRAQAARPVVLIPGSVAFAETAAVAALVAAERAAKPGVALLVGALVSGPEASARGGELAPHLDVLGFGLAERLPGPADPRTGEPDAEVAGLAAAITQVRAAAGGKPLRLGLYPLDPGSSDERAVTSAARLGLDFVVCSPLRAPIGRLIAAQVRLRQATTSTL
jgi:pyruvate,orthophosphate dikinase